MTTLGVAGCLGGGGETATETVASPFPAGSCLAAITAGVPDPLYGFEFDGGVDPEVGSVGAGASGSVTASDGTVTFGNDGGEIRVEDVRPVDDLTVSLFANPAVAAEDQWNVMLWYSPDLQWAGWGIEHGKGAVDFWAEGPGESGSEVLTKSSSGLPVDAWTHVLAVKRGAELLLYVDGERVATSTFDYDAISYGGADTVDMVLGRHAGSGVGDRHFRGSLDSVAVWDGALSTDEVDALLSAAGDCR